MGPTIVDIIQPSEKFKPTPPHQHFHWDGALPFQLTDGLNVTQIFSIINSKYFVYTKSKLKYLGVLCAINVSKSYFKYVR